MAFDPNEARDEHGRWTAGAGGDIPVAPDPRVATVAGGDIWNKDTAARLENEYAAARPAIDKIANDAPEHEGEVTVTTEPGWDALSGTSQDKAEEAYQSDNYDSEYQNEVDNWQQSGEASVQAAKELSEDEDWKAETLTDYLAGLHDADTGTPFANIPYSADDLAKAITIEAADDYSGSKHDPDIGFDPQELQHPTDINPNIHPDQLIMPGITPPTDVLENHLTPAMRADITAYFTEQFNDQVEKNADNVDAPDYLSDNINESLSDSWAQMGDEEKYDWTKHNTSLADDLEAEKETEIGSLELPKKWDPLNEGSGVDYTRTQVVAKYIADTRAVQLMGNRGISVHQSKMFDNLSADQIRERITGIERNLKDGTLPGKASEIGHETAAAKIDLKAYNDELTYRAEHSETPPIDDVRAADAKMWEGWKGSSTGPEGKLIQVAAADELGGRLREATPENQVERWTVSGLHASPQDYASATGATIEVAHELVTPGEAALAAKAAKASPTYSEYTSAFAKLGSDIVPAAEKASAQKIVDAHNEAIAHGEPTTDKTPTLKIDMVKEDQYNRSYTKLPGLDLQRNGAASFTTDAKVANEWNGTTNKAPQGIERQQVIDQANKDFKDVGGYDGAKAILRAKWETSQYMLDKADTPVLNLYRGITLPHRTAGTDSNWEVVAHPSGSGFALRTVLGVDANGDKTYGIYALNASGVGTAQWPTEANAKSGMALYTPKQDDRAERVVIRAEVPRTAVLSVPAFGQNIHSEHEVVITGTAWHNWDAYSGRAPRAEAVPIGSGNVIVSKSNLSPAAQKQLADDLGETHPDAGKVTIKLTPDQEDFVAKYKKTIPKEQQL